MREVGQRCQEKNWAGTHLGISKSHEECICLLMLGSINISSAIIVSGIYRNIDIWGYTENLSKELPAKIPSTVAWQEGLFPGPTSHPGSLRPTLMYFLCF